MQVFVFVVTFSFMFLHPCGCAELYCYFENVKVYSILFIFFWMLCNSLFKEGKGKIRWNVIRAGLQFAGISSLEKLV
jgi:hypothetical protein